MKILAKIGLVAAAAATVLFIFVFEVYKPKPNNKGMAAPPEELVDNMQYLTEETPVETQVVEDTPDQLPLETVEDTPEPLTDEVIAEETPAPVVEETPSVQMRRIYGKITLSSTGEHLAGVNIMVPGSNVAKISNNIGGYTIQIPRGTRELIFIYRGKKLVKRLNSSNNLLNVRLNLETMQYD